MLVNSDGRKVFSNIETKGIKSNVRITPEMIIKKEIIGEKRSGEPVFELKFNREFWESTINKEKSINVVLDEAHTLLNSRRSMSKKALIMGDFLALLRRILGSSDAGYGELTLITQLPKRLDTIARDMATSVWFCTMFYDKECNECGYSFNESNEIAEPKHRCPNCNSLKLIKRNHVMRVLKFKSIADYEAWQYFGMKSYYDKYYLQNLERYFPMYNTFQWDNLLEDF